MDVNLLIDVDQDQLTEEEKDNICHTLAKADLTKLTDVHSLKTALKLLQGLLSYKVEQVESLGLELDELASKQGEEEAHFIQEIEELRSQLSKSPQENDVGTEEDLKQLLLESEQNAQRLLLEMQAQEQEQLSNKMEMEKLESQLASLESDRLQLKRELSALQEEIQDQQRDIKSENQEPQKRYQQLVESLRQKNKHLSSLLNDVEASEKENITLRGKLTNIKIELAEATKNIMQTTGEIVTLQIMKDEQAEKLRYFEQMCEALRHQVKELVDEREKRDAELETFRQQIDVRVDEWKKIAAMKDKELSDLHGHLAHQSLKGQHVMKNYESDQVALLSQTLQKRESQIEELQAQLSQATKDLNETSSLLENMHRTSEFSQAGNNIHNMEESENRVVAAEERIRALEEKLKDAENDADGKSEEITKMIIQLRSYEAGEFGLAEALAQVKDLSRQQAVRDNHIEQLVGTANLLRDSCDCLEEENLTLREQLNISPKEHVQTSSKVLKRKDKNILTVQQQQIERLEEDLISIRMDRRNLSQQVLNLSKQLQENELHPLGLQKSAAGAKLQSRSKADARATARRIRALQQEQHQLSIERQTLIDENEALRQGLHDILDSVHNQDGKSNVRLESKVLEQLLHALDSRHISGWYHPAMRIQAQVNAIEGNNEALREQLHNLREEESRAQTELQTAKLRIAELEEYARERKVPSPPDRAKEEDDRVVKSKTTTSLELPIEISSQELDVVMKINKHLLQVLYELEVDKSHIGETLSIQSELQTQLEGLVAQLVQTVHQHNVEKEKWEQEKAHLEEQFDMMEAKLTASDAKVSQLTSLWDTFSTKDDLKREIVADFLNYSALVAEKVWHDRMAKAAQLRASKAKASLQIIRSEWNASKESVMMQFSDLLQFKKNSLCRLSELELALINSVSIASFKAVNQHAVELTAKYDELLRQHEITVSATDQELKKIMLELELERELNQNMAKQLEEINKKLETRNLNNDVSIQQKLNVQLARAEGEILREKQQAYHAEKMSEIIKKEAIQVSKRCVALEEEVVVLLRTNHQLNLEIASMQQTSLIDLHTGDRGDIQTQLANARSKVIELEASQKHLQELANISQAQVQMLDQLHERSELQLDSLRQVLYKFQSESDLGSEVARLNEELCASQISELAAWNQIAGIEKQRNEYFSLNQNQAKEIEVLQHKLNSEKQKLFLLNRTILEKVSAQRECSENNLPRSFFHLLVTAYSNRSAECRDLWRHLQQVKQELASVTINTEEKTLSRQQTLELQKALQASHSDQECQQRMESWAADLTELKIKDLKNSRQCEVMESNLNQLQERLQNQENLLSCMEQQLLTLGFTQLHILPGKSKADTFLKGIGEIVPDNKPTEVLLSSGSTEAKLDKNPVKTIISPKNSSQPESQSEIKELLNNEILMKDQLISLKEEITKLTAQLKINEGELLSYRELCSELKQSLLEKDISNQSVVAEELPETSEKAENDGLDTPVYDKIVLQATVDSLQNIITQKEETISRYQKFLRDVREEDARIITALQEHLCTQQADLTAQEQAYIRLKISMHHLTMEANGDAASKVSLEEQLTHSNELEDEVTLLNAKVSSLSSEVQKQKQEATYWSSVAQQHISTIEELNIRLLELKSSDKNSSFCVPYHDTLVLNASKSNNPLTNCKSEHEKQEKIKSSKGIDGLPKVRNNQIQIQLNVELIDLKNKVLQMEEQERQHKNEIQRLRDQIPIYSRRTQQSSGGPLLPEREVELLKKIKSLEQQLQQRKADHANIIEQHCQQETKKIKSVENVARWDERKKHQMQIERLKVSLQEQTDEVAMLHDKMQRMHSTVHRLEREKIALEHQIRNLNHVQQDNALLEERLKNLERNTAAQCMLEELQQDRDKLYAEVQILKAKDTSRDQGDYVSDNVLKERADLLKANLELECENLEMKLELEKVQPELLCLRHKVNHFERLFFENGDVRQRDCPAGSIQDATIIENKILMQKVQQLSQQLETANHQLKTSGGKTDHCKVSALQAELNQKCSLLVKVKTLLERAAIKEKQLAEQVRTLEATLAKK